MSRHRDRSLVSALALGAAIAGASAVHAQTSPPPTSASPQATTAPPGAAVAPATPGAGPAPTIERSTGAAPAPALDEIVVTASPSRDRSRLKSSISVNSVSQEQINQFTPRSEAEVFRLIPGIRAEDTAGSGGNSNITVRGLPIVTGGSEFVALQEDGLPVTLFGDMNFGNNDYWIRYDSTVQRLEAVRGGSSSTLASQAPGAVINYISNTGRQEGGVVSVTTGLNYDDTRVDFNYGAPINDSWRFNIGGFYRNGDSPLGYPYTASDGYQIKANATYTLPDNKGFIQFNFKRLDDKEPTFTTSPFIASLNGDEVGDFKKFPGFTAGSDTNQSEYNRSFQILGYNGGGLRTVDMQGIHPVVTSGGFTAHYDFNSNFSVEDKLRVAGMSGVFATQFYNLTPTSSIIGSQLNGSTVGSIVYANGPNQGKLFTGAFVNTNPNIYVRMRDMGNFVNDLSASDKFNLPYGRVTVSGGWFHMDQTIDQTWHVNKQYNDVTGDNPAQLDLFSGPNGAGAQLTAAGQAGFNNNWGDSGSRNYDLDYVDDAPYLAADWAWGPLDVSGSLRYDIVSASGTAQGGVTGPNVTVADALGTATLPSVVTGGTPEKIDYSTDYLSYSFGILYALNANNSLFGRISEGGRANADRLILSGYFDANGKPNAAGKPKLQNTVDQQEIGFKSQGRLFDTRYNFEATYFFAQTSDSNYDLTSQQAFDNVYHSNGLEVDGGLHWRGFSLYGDMTYTHARISHDASGLTTGNTPLATPAVAWLISPSYAYGRFEAGLSFTGQTSTYADNTDQLEIEGQTFVNGFLKVNLPRNIVFTVNANNLFDTLGTRGRSDGGETTPAQVTAYGAAIGASGVFTGSAVLGRTITGSLALRF
ncbi:MAG: TonB-dependent receptor [Caulobacteraceae bacterium]|nr:TonB-dependent receptor [Caulobacter sp.]